MNFDEILTKALLSETKCPFCGSEAYVGLNKVECNNPKCAHYKPPTASTQEPGFVIKDAEFIIRKKGMEIFFNGKKPDKPYTNHHIGMKNLILGNLEFNGIKVYEIRFNKNPWNNQGDAEVFDIPDKMIIDYGSFKGIVNNTMTYTNTAHGWLRQKATGGTTKGPYNVKMVDGTTRVINKGEMYYLFITS